MSFWGGSPPLRGLLRRTEVGAQAVREEQVRTYVGSRGGLNRQQLQLVGKHTQPGGHFYRSGAGNCISNGAWLGGERQESGGPGGTSTAFLAGSGRVGSRSIRLGSLVFAVLALCRGGPKLRGGAWAGPGWAGGEATVSALLFRPSVRASDRRQLALQGWLLLHAPCKAGL